MSLTPGGRAGWVQATTKYLLRGWQQCSRQSQRKATSLTVEGVKHWPQSPTSVDTGQNNCNRDAHRYVRHLPEHSPSTSSDAPGASTSHQGGPKWRTYRFTPNQKRRAKKKQTRHGPFVFVVILGGRGTCFVCNHVSLLLLVPCLPGPQRCCPVCLLLVSTTQQHWNNILRTACWG